MTISELRRWAATFRADAAKQHIVDLEAAEAIEVAEVFEELANLRMDAFIARGVTGDTPLTTEVLSGLLEAP